MQLARLRCGPCKLIEPHLQQLACDTDRGVRVVKAKLDESPSLRVWLLEQGISVSALPTNVLFKDGKPVRALAGAFGYSTLARFVDDGGGGGAEEARDRLHPRERAADVPHRGRHGARHHDRHRHSVSARARAPASHGIPDLPACTSLRSTAEIGMPCLIMRVHYSEWFCAVECRGREVYSA